MIKRLHPFRVLLISLLLIGIVCTTICFTAQSPLRAFCISAPPYYTRTLSELKEEGCCFDQSLMLINEHHPLSDDFVPMLTEYRDSDVWMNEPLCEAYRLLADAVRIKTGDTLYISSAARDRDEQVTLYEDDPTVAQKPRCSEHEAGLALDVYVEGYAGMGFIKSEAGRFVNAHCQEYGFVIRYPLFKESVTGIAYEPWHIRYVGKPHAELMTRFHLTLEDYIEQLLPDSFYRIDNYIVSRQPLRDGKLMIPASCVNLCISPDNTGCYILTGKVAKL